jgi:NAD(P)H-dependent flavin oxidoreductase YrpB (nitropropane dioxygenase family)
MKTVLCERRGNELPIIQAPMGGAGGPTLAAAVSNAGGLGMLAPRADIETVRRQIRETRALTSRPFGVNLNLDFPQEERLGTVATMPLVPAMVDAVSPAPVVAAGGIADGRGLAAALALGAAGAWIGTRFLVSHEAAIHPRYRERVLQANESDTVFLENLFDVGWPNAPHRTLKNQTVAAWETAGCPPSGKRPGEGEVIGTSGSIGRIVHYQSYTPGPDVEGDIDIMSLWAGQSVGLVSKLQSAGDIVREIADEAKAILRRLAQ